MVSENEYFRQAKQSRINLRQMLIHYVKANPDQTPIQISEKTKIPVHHIISEMKDLQKHNLIAKIGNSMQYSYRPKKIIAEMSPGELYDLLERLPW